MVEIIPGYLHDRGLLIEGVINFIGFLAILIYIFSIIRNRTSSGVERRLVFLLTCIGSIFLLRGLSHPFDIQSEIAEYIFFFATLFSLALILTTEGLLRRHLPFFIKVVAAFYTVTFIGLIPVKFYSNNTLLAFFLAGQAFFVACMFYFLYTRDQTSLSEEENQLIQILKIPTFIAIPLLITDHRALFPEIPLRMGAVGGLLFVYAFLKSSHKLDRDQFPRDILNIFIESVILTFIASAIKPNHTSLSTLVQYFALFISLRLFFSIIRQIRSNKISSVKRSFLTALSEMNLRGSTQPIEELRQKFSAYDMLLVNEENLNGYNVEIINKWLLSRSQCPSLSRLYKLRRSTKVESDLQAIEQIIDILENNGMNQLYIVSSEPLVLFLIYSPTVGGQFESETEALVSKKLVELSLR